MLALAAALALAAPVPKDKPDLTWRFVKGDAFTVKFEQQAVATRDGNTTVSAAGIEYTLTVLAADDKETKLGFRIKAAGGGQAEGADAKPERIEVPNAAGLSATITLDAKLKVTAVEAEAVPQTEDVGRLLKEEYLSALLDDVLRAVPGKALAEGETWTGERETKLTADVSVKRAERGTVGKTADGLTTLNVEMDLEWVGGAKLGLDLKGEKGKRTVTFDGTTGRVRSVEDEYTLTGTGKSEVTSKVKAKITVTDEKPKGK